LIKTHETLLSCKKCGQFFLWARTNGHGREPKYCKQCKIFTHYNSQSEEIREKTFRRFDNTCQKCGKSDGKLIVHHIDFDECNNSEENLVLVCHSCHGKIPFFLAQKAKKLGFLYEWNNEWLRDKEGISKHE